MSTRMRANPTPWRNHPRRDCGSHPPRDACPKGSGQFHASSENTLPDTRAGYKNDSGECCAEPVSSGNMLWKREEKVEKLIVARERLIEPEGIQLSRSKKGYTCRTRIPSG